MNWKALFDRKFAVAILLLLGGLLAISPAGLRKSEILSTKELAAAITSRSLYATAEELSAWIIDKKADLNIIDLRSSVQFHEYHIPGASNIPLAKLFDEESLEQLPHDLTTILYSNASTDAAQAWILLKQKGVDSYVLMGGLNYWAKAILNPEAPGDLVADSEILQYQFRKAASGYFKEGLGINQSGEKSPVKPKPKIKFKKKKSAEEGC